MRGFAIKSKQNLAAAEAAKKSAEQETLEGKFVGDGGSSSRRSSRRIKLKQNLAAAKVAKQSATEGTLDIGEGVPSSRSSSRTRKRSVFDTPPSDYNSEVFKANFPFVGVVETDYYPQNWPLDKVGDASTMDEEALLAAVRAMTKSTTLSARAYKRPRTESGDRVIHGSLAMDLWMVTSPSSQPKMITLEDVVAASERRPADLPMKSAEDQEDVVIKIGEMMKLEGDSSNESVTIVHEEDERFHNSTRADLRFLVRDKRMKILDNLVLALLVECKWDGLSRNVIFQAAAYVAKKSALKNMHKGRSDPIYLQAWGEKLWCYGIFYPLGLVEVQGGKVVSTTNLTVEKMETLLCAATQELRDISGNKRALYPDGTYISGTLYVPHEKKYHLPDMMEKGGASTPGAKRFFQSLLRIVVGEVVLKWTVDDANKVIEARRKMLEDTQREALRTFSACSSSSLLS